MLQEHEMQDLSALIYLQAVKQWIKKHQGAMYKREARIQEAFAFQIAKELEQDDTVIGLAAGGSWLTNEMDEFSDLDLVVVTREKMTDDPVKMKAFARRFGNLLAAFTGEHVGEPRLLICLYEDPFLHVDFKFLVLQELSIRIENPFILLDKEQVLQKILEQSEAKFPYPDYQWIEDRFWTWIHYGLLKIGRGELTEAHDFLASLRMMVLGPLLHIKNGQLPRGVRKAEMAFAEEDMEALAATMASLEPLSLISAIEQSVGLYSRLRSILFNDKIVLQYAAREKVLQYLEDIRSRASR